MNYIHFPTFFYFCQLLKSLILLDSLEFAFLRRFLYSNSASNGCTDHRVVAHADETFARTPKA